MLVAVPRAALLPMPSSTSRHVVATPLYVYAPYAMRRAIAITVTRGVITDITARCEANQEEDDISTRERRWLLYKQCYAPRYKSE